MTKVLSCVSELDDFKNKDFYQILEISRDASQEEIKKAYRKMAKKFHPDLNVEDTTEKMKAINEAYDTLSDVDKRKEYDKRFNVANEKAYSTYTKSQEESEADLDDWLKAYLSRRRLLNKLYEMYIKNEAGNKRMREYFIRPPRKNLLLSEELLEKIRCVLSDMFDNSLDNPGKILDYLFTEIESSANAVGYYKRYKERVNIEAEIKMNLLLDEINLVIQSFGNENNPQYHNFIKYILRRYEKVSDIISTYRRCDYLPEPYQELIKEILEAVIKTHKDYINGLINKRDS